MRIVAGEMPDLTVRDNDFFFLQKSSGRRRSLQTVVDLCARRLPASYGYSPVRDIQVICAHPAGGLRYSGTLPEAPGGAQSRRTGRKAEQKFSLWVVFREGDKVMQIRNNYDIV